MSDEQLTEQEKEEIRSLVGYGGSVSDGRHNAHTFLHNVVTASDTTRLGNLREEEIGTLDNPIRAFKFLGLFSDKIMGKKGLSGFFEQRSEIGTSTSLSRGGFLTRLAVIQRKEIADTTPIKPQQENKGWFKKKEPQTPEVVQ